MELFIACIRCKLRCDLDFIVCRASPYFILSQLAFLWNFRTPHW